MLSLKKKLTALVLCAAALSISAAISSSPAKASSTVYSYTGDFFTSILDDTPPAGTYTTSMHVTGSFTLLNPLSASMAFTDISANVQSFSFSDGRNTLTNASTLQVKSFEVSTNLSGNIDDWRVQLVTAAIQLVGQQQLEIITEGTGSVDAGSIHECVTSSGTTCLLASVDNGETVEPNGGNWTSAAATPLPAALPLFATGLGGLGFLGWRRKRKQAV